MSRSTNKSKKVCRAWAPESLAVAGNFLLMTCTYTTTVLARTGTFPYFLPPYPRPCSLPKEPPTLKGHVADLIASPPNSSEMAEAER